MKENLSHFHLQIAISKTHMRMHFYKTKDSLKFSSSSGSETPWEKSTSDSGVVKTEQEVPKTTDIVKQYQDITRSTHRMRSRAMSRNQSSGFTSGTGSDIEAVYKQLIIDSGKISEKLLQINKTSHSEDKNVSYKKSDVFEELHGPQSFPSWENEAVNISQTIRIFLQKKKDNFKKDQASQKACDEFTMISDW